MVKKTDDVETWDAVYNSESDFQRSTSISWLEAGLKDNRLLYAYYPVARLAKKIPEPVGKSIEIGCGSGRYSLVLKKLGLIRDAVLLDFSTSALDSAERLFKYFGETCTLIHSSLDDMEFEAQSFDLAFSGGLVEHFRTTAERRKYIKAHTDTARWTIIQAPAYSTGYWVQRMIITLIKRGWPFGFERPYSNKELLAIADDIGVSLEAIDYQYFLNFLIFLMPKLVRIKAVQEPQLFARLARTDIAVLLKNKC